MRGRSRACRAFKLLGTALCAALLAAWGASYGTMPDLSLGQSFAFLHCGRIVVSIRVDSAYSGRNEWLREHLSAATKHLPVEYALLGDAHLGGGWHALIIPFWTLLAVVATPTGVLWLVDRRRIPPGHCQHCGYDLTGNISGRCPECGEVVRAGE
jgi:hypothetical protein